MIISLYTILFIKKKLFHFLFIKKNRFLFRILFVSFWLQLLTYCFLWAYLNVSKTGSHYEFISLLSPGWDVPPRIQFRCSYSRAAPPPVQRRWFCGLLPWRRHGVLADHHTYSRGRQTLQCSCVVREEIEIIS